MCCKKNVERVHVIFGPFLNATWSLGEHIWAVFRWLLFWWKSSTSGSHLGILVTSGTVLCTTRDRVSFVENVAGLWTFKVGFVFFCLFFPPPFHSDCSSWVWLITESFRSPQVSDCLVPILPLPSFLRGPNITMGTTHRTRWDWEPLMEGRGPSVQEITGLFWRGKFISSIMHWLFTLCWALRSNRWERVYLPPPSLGKLAFPVVRARRHICRQLHHELYVTYAKTEVKGKCWVGRAQRRACFRRGLTRTWWHLNWTLTGGSGSGRSGQLRSLLWGEDHE